ncbi:MAG: insulinase family protein [Fibrobacterota bacterium]|nr:MAG: insulinase family protein [Fibrobacterota bacterium]
MIASILGSATAMLLSATVSGPATPPNADQAVPEIRLAVRDTVFANGLRVLVHEDHSLPMVACQIFYATGSIHEHAGGTGIAHMLEHMLFKGTRKVGITDSTADAKFLPQIDAAEELRRAALAKGDSATAHHAKARMDSLNALHRAYFVKDELWQAYQEVGGTDLNAYTSDLATVYHVTLPSNRLELFLWMESDRMTRSVMRDFYAERDVVREERRMRIENKPQGRYWESLDLLFWGAHPYGNPTIGWPSDIESYRRSQVEEHYEKFYGPKNAILVLSGDVKAEDAFAMTARYFAGITKGADFPQVVTRDPEPPGQKRLVSIQDNARPVIDILFPVPDINDPQSPAFEIVEGVLSGASGRLERLLVDSLRLCTSVSAGHRAQIYASQFGISATPVQGADPRRIEDILWNEIARLRESPLSPREIQRVKNRLAVARLARLRSRETIAGDLGYMELFGSWKLLAKYPAKVQLQTDSTVREAAAKWLRPERATIGWLLPKNHSEHTRTGVYQ